MASQTAMMGAAGKPDYGIWRVILASAAGTMIEWYDFFIFGSLVTVLSLKFYPPGNDIFAYIAYLATFAVGFVVRPFGALFFGRIGDVVGRKYGATAACGVVSYMAALYPLFYLQTILKVDEKKTIFAVALGILMGVPFVTLFGWLSDKVGRKWLMMAACLLAVVTYIPIYKGMQHAAGNEVVTVNSTKNKVTGAISLTAMTLDPTTRMQIPAKEAVTPNLPVLVLLLFVQQLYFSMIYGPIAAYLVEAFPARIRYTSLSLPYHIGFGIFGGSLPLIGLSLCAATGNIYAGLYYPMTVAAVTLVVGSLLLKETHGTRIWDEVEGHRA